MVQDGETWPSDATVNIAGSPVKVPAARSGNGTLSSKDVAVFEANDANLDSLLHRNNAEVRQYPEWTPGRNERWAHYGKRLFTEGHTFFDAWLLAAGCIGQIMMTTPNSWYKTGLIPGAILIVAGTLIGFWTIWQLKAMYYDRKRDMIKKGIWFDDPDRPYARRYKTQLQELIGYYLGPWGTRAIVFMFIIYWIGVGVVQILASATNYYAIDQTHSLRTYCLAFGAALLPFGFIPTFRKMRVILIFGVSGTLYAALYGIYVASQKGYAEASAAQLWPKATGNPPFLPFFNGAAVLFAILDHHNIFPETIEAMQHPRKYFKSYMAGFLPLFIMIVPPGILLNLAFAKSGIATAQNWLQLAPLGLGKYACVWMTNLHNVQAFTLWMTSFGYLWEKLCGTHDKRLWIRLSSRLPYLLFIYFFAVAFPFYSAINSLITGLFAPLLAYTVPCWAFVHHYKHKEHRDNCIYPGASNMFKVVGWRTIAFIYYSLMAYGIVLVGFTSSLAILNLIKLSNTFGLFPECYGCAAYRHGP